MKPAHLMKCSDLIRRDSGPYTHQKQHKYWKCVHQIFGIARRIVLFLVRIRTRNPPYQVRWVSGTLLLANTRRNTEDSEGRHNVIIVENTKATVQRYVYPPIWVGRPFLFSVPAQNQPNTWKCIFRSKILIFRIFELFWREMRGWGRGVGQPQNLIFFIDFYVRSRVRPQ